MKQENKFVAQLYHYLAPFVDESSDLFICVDGGAATHHAGNNGAPITDPVLPDLWFTLKGKTTAIGIEAKVKEGTSISVRQSQLSSWQTGGNGDYTPKYWVTTNTNLTEFSCWHHASLIGRLDTTNSTVSNVKLSLSSYPADYTCDNLAELALYIMVNY